MSGLRYLKRSRYLEEAEKFGEDHDLEEEILGSWAMIWRYIPTPESSEGTALNVFAFPTLGGPLVTEILRTRLVDCAPTGVTAPALFIFASVLGLFEAKEVVLPFANLESTVLPTFLLVVCDPGGRVLLAGLREPTPTALLSLGSGERNRVPNLDSFSDWRPAKEDGAVGLVRT